MAGDTQQRRRRAVPSRITVLQTIPYLSIHLLLLGLPFVGVSWTAALICLALFAGRMFIITAFYHRYFSHRTFKTSRPVQFTAALAGTTCAQRGPIWWAAHHRDHHRHSDQHDDIHSPHLYGLIWSHMGWFLSQQGVRTNWRATPDWARTPELVWLERWHMIGPIGLALAVFALGAGLERWAPGLGATGPQLLVWGFGLSTVLLYHATFTINSLAHVIGSRRFATRDDSRNNFWLALLTLGEGWHNNHHYYPGSARQGFYWWEIDLSYYALRAMQAVGLIWDLRAVPHRVYEAAEAHHERLATGPPHQGPVTLLPPLERDSS